jgi:3-phenylpropionate/cinnamic acid dioxygenase small subunit
VDRVEILWAVEQIRQLKAKYCRLADTRKDDLFLALFTDDLEWTLYSEDGTQVIKRVQGKEEYRQWRASHRATRLAGFSVHHVHNPEIEILDEDHARGVWPLMDYLRQPDKEKNYVGYGHYHEEYRREAGGQWRIAAVKVTRLHVDRLGGET